MLMYPILIYFREVQWRLFYCILSLTATILLTFYYIELIFLYETYPFIKLIHKKFIATHITELFDSVLYVSFFITIVSTFPLFFYHISTFFSNSWFFYQVRLLQIYLFISFHFIFISFLFINSNLLPRTFEFFTQWEIRQSSSLLQLQLDARIYYYLLWIIGIYNFINFLCCSLITISFLIFLFSTPDYFYLFVKQFKNKVWFFILIMLFIFSPSDFSLQLILIVITTCMIELLFFISCFYITQSNIHKDNSKVIGD